MTAYKANMRDRIAVRLSNLMLGLATDHYRRFIRDSIEYGMRAAVRDHETGTPPPRDWRGTSGRNPLPLVQHPTAPQPHGPDRAPETDRSEDV